MAFRRAARSCLSQRADGAWEKKNDTALPLSAAERELRLALVHRLRNRRRRHRRREPQQQPARHARRPGQADAELREHRRSRGLPRLLAVGLEVVQALVPARREPRLGRQLLGEVLGSGVAEARLRARRCGDQGRLPGDVSRHRRRLPGQPGQEGLSRHHRRAAPRDDRLRHRALAVRQGAQARLPRGAAERGGPAGARREQPERAQHRLPQGDRRPRGRGPLVRRQQHRRLDPGRPEIHQARGQRRQVRPRHLLPDPGRQAGRLRQQRDQRRAHPLRRRPRPDRQDRLGQRHHRVAPRRP